MKPAMLEQCKILIDFLGETLGPDYEIVLQDLSDESSSIAAIANGHVSGRKIGSPLTNAALQMLSSRAYENSDFLCNYKGIAEDGRVLRSSTMFIKDESRNPIALLCINFDDSRYQELSQRLLSIIHPDDFKGSAHSPDSSAPDAELAQEPYASAITETFPMDIPTLMQKIFDDCTCDINTPIDRLNQHERKAVVSRLHEQGLFQLKGAVSFVAKKFSCSTATVYRYLSEITN